MKIPAFLALMCLAGGAAAQDFAYRIELAAPGAQAAYRVALPADVHRGITRADFADLRVVNGAGEALPFALMSGAPRAAEEERHANPPLFPVYREPGAAPGLELQVRQNADGTLISLASRGTSAPSGTAARAPAYWLVDTSRLDKPMRALKLDWRAGQAIVASLRVEAGDDLASWRLLAAGAPLVELNAGAAVLRQDSVVFAPARARYLRLSIEARQGEPPALDAIAVTLAGDRPEIPLGRVEGTASIASGALEVGFDLGGAFAVERVGFRLPQQNTLAPAEILVRDDPAAAWRPLARAVVYRLAPREAGGEDLRSPPVGVGPTAARYWLLRLDPKSGGLGSGAVQIEAQYTQRHVVFVARGNGPFAVEYGRHTPAGERAQAVGSALALPTVLPGYREGDEWKLPEAVAGKAVAINPAALARTLGTELDLKKVALWAMLLFAVLILGVLAWRMLRDPVGKGR